MSTQQHYCTLNIMKCIIVPQSYSVQNILNYIEYNRTMHYVQYGTYVNFTDSQATQLLYFGQCSEICGCASFMNSNEDYLVNTVD